MLLVAALALSASAVAGERPVKPAKPERAQGAEKSKRTACHKKRAVLLRGTFLAAGTNSFTMNVVRANRHGRALKGEQTVNVDERTKIRRHGKEGPAALTDLVKDDRLKVLARCKPGETAGTFVLLARHVKARAPKAESGS